VPDELAAMIRQIRDLEQAMGNGGKRPQTSEWDTRQAARQQILFSRPVKKGQVITQEALTTARCGRGISPMGIWDLIGSTAARDYEAGEVPE
jgi:N-acetylneuraminate synthase